MWQFEFVTAPIKVSTHNPSAMQTVSSSTVLHHDKVHASVK
jgi:hypothetical protein